MLKPASAAEPERDIGALLAGVKGTTPKFKGKSVPVLRRASKKGGRTKSSSVCCLPLPRSATIGEQLACIWRIVNRAHCSMGNTEVTSLTVQCLAVIFNYVWRIAMIYICAINIVTRRAPYFNPAPRRLFHTRCRSTPRTVVAKMYIDI